MSTSKWFTGSSTPEKRARQYILFSSLKEQGKVVLEDDIYVPIFTERVKAGMNLLDKINPGWEQTLDFSSLDLESDQLCVLGQSWPHYAHTHGLIEKADGDYKEFANTVLSVGDVSEGDRNLMASSVGCALSEDDFAAINSQANMAPIELVHERIAQINAKFWEVLTKTWITEINKAHAEGRWAKKEESVTT